MPLSGILRHEDGFFFLISGGESNPLPARRTNERRARRFMTIARIMGSLIRRFPFVRGLYISGELSKGVLSKKGDIDFLIVTAPGRVWVCRTLIILFKKIFLLNRKRLLCANHFVAEDYFEIPERNRYTALEAVTLKPVFNGVFLSNYVRENSWILDFFPNVGIPEAAGEPKRPVGILQGILEYPLRGRAGDAIDATLMNFWRTVWTKRYAHVPEEKRNQLFRTERSLSTAYAGDFLTQILSQYKRRLSDYHLDRMERP